MNYQRQLVFQPLWSVALIAVSAAKYPQKGDHSNQALPKPRYQVSKNIAADKCQRREEHGQSFKCQHDFSQGMSMNEQDEKHDS